MSKILRIWGEPDEKSKHQMYEALASPVVVRGALMPDAHLGYGIPIGGVIECEEAVIPYAVGVDIACRVRLSILDLSADQLTSDKFRGILTDLITEHTRFGVGCTFDEDRNDHPVMESRDWEVVPYDKDQAHAQLGTSGSGNHFIDIGRCGDKIAILTHSGSRGAGAATCQHYSDLAKEQSNLGPMSHLHMDTQEGQDYWRAMNLMGEYASANHWCIHNRIINALHVNTVQVIENHHNFAWKEEGYYVHRKGATPAGAKDIGVIPGTMAHPSYIVRGLGSYDSINSCSHGAGRILSRSQAKKTLDAEAEKESIRERGVLLLSAGVDEYPGAYKNPEEVMSYQTDLCEILGEFHPVIVKMAGKAK